MCDTGTHFTFTEVVLVTLAVTFAGGRGSAAKYANERKSYKWLAPVAGRMNRILNCDWYPSGQGGAILPTLITRCVSQENCVLY